jgi:DNA-binding XRE family transcriptional regulator
VESKDFAFIRKKMRKTQRQMANLLGSSLKAVQSYEQGWRTIPVHVERQILFLISRFIGKKTTKPCWDTKNCPPELRKKCPAREFKAGDLCWFVGGTICDGKVQKDWNEKMKMCRSCEVLSSMFNQLNLLP